MNRIRRINNFLEAYRSLDPYLKSICKGSKDYYQMELMHEYINASRHPFCHEYLDPHK